MRRPAFLALLLCSLATHRAPAAPLVSTSAGEDMVVGTLVYETPAEAAVLGFIVQERGDTVSGCCVHSGPWMEAFYRDDFANRALPFQGPLDPSAVDITPGADGSLRLPLGDFGTADVVFEDHGPDSAPLTCRLMYTGLFVWQWRASATLAQARIISITATVGTVTLYGSGYVAPRGTSRVVSTYAGDQPQGFVVSDSPPCL